MHSIVHATYCPRQWHTDTSHRQSALQLGKMQLRSPRPTQPSIPLGSVNEYQLRLGRQKHVWFIQLVDVCRVYR